ncbi:MAG: hypothetical protein M0C28_18705 [Candidatus Moduliflexus flocculans]|nr:hypothetical protein [Candidatus Moduliflexus flocculans]
MSQAGERDGRKQGGVVEAALRRPALRRDHRRSPQPRRACGLPVEQGQGEARRRLRLSLPAGMEAGRYRLGLRGVAVDVRDAAFNAGTNKLAGSIVSSDLVGEPAFHRDPAVDARLTANEGARRAPRTPEDPRRPDQARRVRRPRRLRRRWDRRVRHLQRHRHPLDKKDSLRLPKCRTSRKSTSLMKVRPSRRCQGWSGSGKEKESVRQRAPAGEGRSGDQRRDAGSGSGRRPDVDWPCGRGSDGWPVTGSTPYGRLMSPFS